MPSACGRDRRLLQPPAPGGDGAPSSTHRHTHTRSVSPPSRSGPFLPAPLPRPRSLLFFFFLFFPSAASRPPSPRRDPLRRAGELRLLLLKLLPRSQRFPLFEGGRGRSRRDPEPQPLQKRVCGSGRVGGLLPTPRSSAAHTGTPPRTMEEEPPFFSSLSGSPR